MKQIFHEYLFQKHILVHEGEMTEGKDAFETLFSLANLFGISVKNGKELADEKMIELAAAVLGKDVPEPFYRGFPQSVRELSPDQLLFDQLLHYFKTYGMGNFDEAGHSVFEETFERTAFKEDCEVREFVILPEEKAKAILLENVEDLLASTRPLNVNQFQMLCEFIKTYDHKVEKCASKNTAVKLMVALRDLQFERFLVLSDVIKVLDEINLSVYASEDLRKLNLKNQDRKLLTRLMDDLFAAGRTDVKNCYEKKAIWCGMLHHVHYQPKCAAAKDFVDGMRGKENESTYSAFEQAMSAGDLRKAADILREEKGSGALLRNLDYIVSRIEKPEDLSYVLERLDTKNNLILMQLLMHYAELTKESGTRARTFQFVKHNVMKVHHEDETMMRKRKSVISRGQALAIWKFIEENLQRNLKGRLGKVYVDESMKRITLPLQEAAAQGGFGVLAKGSRISVPEGKKIRAFTYWEKVGDIDLSLIGMDDQGNQMEFSWRTMADLQSDVLTFSGDETSGYNGGSEYFDIDLEGFQKLYPNLQMLIFCNNVFSAICFDQCYCTAGFMIRDLLDSGAVFEPKTVQTSFQINYHGMFAYLFGIDLKTRELVWLNAGRNGAVTVAGTTSLSFLSRYFHAAEILNVHRFFEMMATELVTDPAQADVIVTDDVKVWEVARENAEGEKEWIRSYDFEKLLALMNS